MSVSVCIALLAASAAVSGAYAANHKSTPSSAIASTNKAYAALVEGRNKSAISNYSSAIESRKLPTEKLARSFLNRALAFQNSGKYQSAINDYTAAIRVDALSPRMRAVALYNRGLAHSQSKSPALAIEDFTGALLLDPQFAQSYYSRANVLRKHGQYLLAIADYKKARRFNHSKPHLTFFGEALTYELLGQTTRAKSLIRKAISAKPDFTAARTKLSDMGGNAPREVVMPKLPRLPIQIALVDPAKMSGNLITGSISPSRPDLIIRKTSLPAPIAVPENIATAQVTIKLPPLPKVVKVKTGSVIEKQPALTSKTAEPVKVAVNAPVNVPVKSPENSKTQILSGWTVQISSQRNSDAAWDVWKNISNRYSALLNRQKAAVVKADLGSRGIFYRLRIHQLDTKKQAAQLCRQLKRKGQGCFVTKA